MRASTAAGLAGLALIGLSACHKAPAGPASGQAAAPSAAPLAAMPQRKAGLWSQQIVVEGTGHAMPASQVCLDAASDARMSMMGAEAGRKACQSNQITHNLDGSWTIASVCDFGQGGRVVSTGTITGDFNSAYQVQITSTTTGASFAGANGEHKMTITSTYAGPCPAGGGPGDVSVNGMRMNMLKGDISGSPRGG